MARARIEARKGDGAALAPGLYIVATPIGNLRDITLRALDVLKGADVIACEDSRVTARLLGAYSIAVPTTPYHEHNAPRARPRLLARLRQGAAVALVSDAGTPLISDPGFKLVAAARAEGIAVFAIPGPSSVLAALTVSGLPSAGFRFAGFLPAKAAARRKALAALAMVPVTLVLFETAPRLKAMLADAAEILGARPAALCRELTKLHEECVTGTLAELAARYAAAPQPKGEIVIVIGAAPSGAEAGLSDDALDAALAAALGAHSLRDAVDRVAAETGAPRRRVYARALALAGRGS